jgi:tripartite-type tricarboxylate transporter receptor subunit TctC
MPFLSRRTLAAASLAVLCLPLASQAQSNYPNQPIKVIVPFPPGGGTDIVARLVTDGIRSSANWNFVIDNKAGAGGNIGIEAVAKSKPDGYTLGLGQTSNLAINPTLYPKVPFDAQKDFVPIAVIASQPVVLVVKADSPYKTLADLVAAAKAKPGQITMASAGNGTVGHLTGEVFAKQAGFQPVHVPYKGAGPAATDLLGGQVAYYFATPPAVIGFIKAGKLRALAVSSSKRLPVLPDVPTVAESGYKGFETSDWKMLVAPKGTPAEVVAKLSGEVQKALGKPETLSRLLSEGSLPGSGSPQQAAQLLQSEQQRWAAVVRGANVKVD